MHEISVDGQQWEPAKERPELFATPAIAISAPTSRGDSYGGSETKNYSDAQTSQETRGTPSVSSSEGWYYVYGGKEQGPVDFAGLYELLASRRLAPETEVWRQGMTDWIPANTVPGLVVNAVTVAQVTQPTEKAAEVGQGVVRVLVESRGWIVFIAVMSFVYAAILLSGGLLMIILGPRLAADTAGGLFQMIFSIVVAFGGWLLMSFAAGVERFHRCRDEDSLAAALVTLRTLWTYVGIVLIVLLTLAVIAVVMLLSMAGSVSELVRRFSP